MYKDTFPTSQCVPSRKISRLVLFREEIAVNSVNVAEQVNTLFAGKMVAVRKCVIQ